MNLIHIALTGRVTDGFTYQDNLLPKYHNKLGYNVALITSHYIHGDSGTLKVDPRDKYINEHGIQIVRIPIKREKEFNYKFKTYHYLYRELNRLQPDIIFVHSVQFLDIITIVNYLELYPHTKVYVDNHADFSNSATNWFSHNILHKVIWRRMAKKIEPYVNKFWGVLPARVDFLRKVYKLPENKTDLLVMGADDDLVEKAISNSMKSNIRQNHKINSDDYLLISGGKIDNAKRQVLNLMDAVHKLPSNYKLIVFGSVTYELQKNFFELVDDIKVIHIPWLNAEEAYEYFAVSNLAVFPGRHSVYWEQAAGIGIPLLVKYWEGTTHVDVNGNCGFLYEDTVEEIYAKVLEISDSQTYNRMLNKAKKASNNFLYSNIAKKSIEL